MLCSLVQQSKEIWKQQIQQNSTATTLKEQWECKHSVNKTLLILNKVGLIQSQTSGLAYTPSSSQYNRVIKIKSSKISS